MNPPANDTGLNRGYSVAFTSALILSTTGILVRHLTETYHIPPIVLAFWRNCFLSLFLLILLELFYPFVVEIRRRDLGYMAIYGLILAAFNLLWTTSVAINGAAIATFLVYSSAGFAALLGWWLLDENMSQAKVLAILLCLTGCAMVSGALGMELHGYFSPLGVTTGIFSGLSYAAYSLMGRSACNRGINPWTTLLYTFGFAAVFLLLFNLLTMDFLPWGKTGIADLFWLGRAAEGWGWLILLAVGPSLVGFGLYNMSLKRLPSSTVNLIATTEPVFTAFLAYLMLGEILGSLQLSGGLLIVAGVLALRVHETRRLALATVE
jgi:drug/metabolite transporter (DMT)-like permease